MEVCYFLELKLDYAEKRILIGVIFCVSLIIANISTIKVIDLGLFDLTIHAGFIIYPIVYIITSIIADVYSKRDAQRNIVFGLGSYIVFLIMVALIVFLPSPSIGNIDIRGAFVTMPRALIAAACAYILGNFITVAMTLHVKRRYIKSNSIFKNIVAIIAGLVVDSIFFMLIAYLGVLPAGRIVSIIVINSVLYIIWMIILTPVVGWFKKWIKF